MKKIIVLLLVVLSTTLYSKNLWNAADSGDLKTIKKFVGIGADINRKSKASYTPLHYAARSGHLKVVEFLLSKGARIEGKDRYGITPLMMAAKGRHIQVVELLLAKKAKVNQTNKNKQTVLTLVAGNDHVGTLKNYPRLSQKERIKMGHKIDADLIKIFIKKGAKRNHRDAYGHTPLIEAAKEGHFVAVKTLIALKTNIHIKSNNGKDAIFYAAQNGHIKVCELLLKQKADPNVSVSGRFGGTPLSLAARKGNLELVELLIENGAKINYRGKADYPPLFEAVKKGKYNVVLYLLGKKASVKITDKTGVDVFNYAYDARIIRVLKKAKRGKFKIAKGVDLRASEKLFKCLEKNCPLKTAIKLLKRGASITDRDKGRRTYLHYCAIFGNAKVARYLLNHGAEVDPVDHQRGTPLTSAAYRGHTDVVRLLIKRRARINHKAMGSNTALTYAKWGGHSQIVDLLKKYGSKDGQDDLKFYEYIRKGNFRGVRRYYRKVSDINHPMEFSDTPLHVAAAKGYAKICRFLLKRKAKVNKTAGTNRYTPLHYAAAYNKLKAIRVLMRYRAKVEPSTRCGLTPLGLAVANDNYSVVKYLIRMGSKNLNTLGYSCPFLSNPDDKRSDARRRKERKKINKLLKKYKIIK